MPVKAPVLTLTKPEMRFADAYSNVYLRFVQSVLTVISLGYSSKDSFMFAQIFHTLSFIPFLLNLDMYRLAVLYFNQFPENTQTNS